MPTRFRTQATWVGSTVRLAATGILFWFAEPGRSLAADPAPAPAEDSIPPAPKRPKKVRPPATDWAQWNDVERFRGHYEGRRSADKDRDNGVSAEHDHSLSLASGEFEMKADGSNWSVVTGKISGSIHGTSTSDRWSYHGRSTTDADFSGPASDFHLHLDTKRGQWKFWVDGRMDKPYEVRYQLTSRNWELPVWVPENRSHTEQKTEYAHVALDADLPRGPPTELQAEWRYQNSTGSIIDYQARVILVPEYKDLELIVEIEGVAADGKSVTYEQWIPRGTVTGAAGSRLKVKARLQAKDGGPAKVHVENFSFTLNDTSREPGVCLNYPLNAAKAAAPDLKFMPGGETDAERQQLDMPSSTDNPEHPHAETRIDCFDFGAWSSLSVTAELADGRTITGHLKGDPGLFRMNLPKRTGGSYIADAWKKAHGVTAGDEDDAEKLPSAGKYPGDGFTLYEEYRGFVVNGQHIEGDPEKVDFFVRNYIGGDARRGIGLFASLTGAELHDRLRDAEFDETKRVMNANHHQGPHRVDQYGVFLRTQPGLKGAETRFVDTRSRGRPHFCTGILVQARTAETAVTTSENLPASELAFAYDRAIAHELLHAVGAEHHGERGGYLSLHLMFADDPRNQSGKPRFQVGSPISGIFCTIIDESSRRDLAEMLQPDLLLDREGDRSKTFDQFRAEKLQAYAKAGSTLDKTYSIDQMVEIEYNDLFGSRYWYLGAEHGQCSGDEGCVMRYYFAKLYEKHGAPYHYYSIGEKHTEHAGMGLCVSLTGTGINDKDRDPRPRYGDSASGWGACATWITFNDAAPNDPAPKP